MSGDLYLRWKRKLSGGGPGLQSRAGGSNVPGGFDSYPFRLIKKIIGHGADGGDCRPQINCLKIAHCQDHFVSIHNKLWATRIIGKLNRSNRQFLRVINEKGLFDGVALGVFNAGHLSKSGAANMHNIKYVFAGLKYHEAFTGVAKL